MKLRGRFRRIAHLDPVISSVTLLLLLFGVVMVYSSSSLVGAERFGDSAYFLKRHLMWLGLGLFGMTLIFFVNPLFWRKLGVPGLVIGCGLLLIVILTGAGVEKKSATRWLTFGGFTFQPSEFVKLILVVYVASYLAKKRTRIRDLYKGLLPLLGTVGAVLFMILQQPDFGTTILMVIVIGLMIFEAEARFYHLAGILLPVLLAGFYLIQSVPYRRRRLLAFFHPWEDPQGSGFQIIQSFVAFQQGGIQGQGLGDGTQKLLYLPEAHTDFIYSVIAEELGLAGSLVVIVLFALLVYRGLRLAVRLQEPFASQIAFGITCLIGLQAFFHMAVVMGMVPTKGLTLPFISYGGSSLVVTLFCIGILLSLSAAVSTSMAKRTPGRKA